MYSVYRCGHRGAEAPASVVHHMTLWLWLTMTMYKLYVSWSIGAAVIQSCCWCRQWLTELAMSPMWQSVTEQRLLLNLTRKSTGNLWHRKTQSTGFWFPELSFVFIILTSYIACHLRSLIHERYPCEQWGRVMQHADKRRQGVSVYMPRVGPGHPFPPLSIYFLIFSPFFTFLFLSLQWLYLFSSFVHHFPLYQNSPTPFPGRRS